MEIDKKIIVKLIQVLEDLKSIVKKLNAKGIQIFITFIPKHFLYFDMYGALFYKGISSDLFIQKIRISIGRNEKYKSFKIFSIFFVLFI